MSNKAELTSYRDMLVAIRENVANLKRQGPSLDDTVATKPTAEFDAKWGQFIINPALFTKLVYEGVRRPHLPRSVANHNCTSWKYEKSDS